MQEAYLVPLSVSPRRPHPFSRLSRAHTWPSSSRNCSPTVQPVTSWAARMAASKSRKPFGKRQTLSGSIVTRSRAQKFNVYEEIDFWYFFKKISILENVSFLYIKEGRERGKYSNGKFHTQGINLFKTNQDQRGLDTLVFKHCRVSKKKKEETFLAILFVQMEKKYTLISSRHLSRSPEQLHPSNSQSSTPLFFSSA